MTVPTPTPDDAGGSPGAPRSVGPAAEPLEDLVAHARDTRVVVVGGGIAGLVAAWECAKVGMQVTVVEASERLGGTIGSTRIGDLVLDTGVTCWSTRGGAVRALVDEVLPGAAIERPRDDTEWIAGLPKQAAAPLPAEQVLGIPANPWDESVRRIIGWGGAWRAYLDRLRPPLTIGKERSLGRLVGGRMGEKVRDRLVAPLSLDRFGVAPDNVDVQAAAPGLGSALTRTGSLGGAVAELRLDATRGAGIESLAGGMPPLVDALAGRLAERGAVVHTAARATGLVRRGGVWTVSLGEAAAAAADARPAELEADAVVVAADEAGARALVGPVLGDESFAGVAAAGIDREVVTLVLDAPALDAAPRGAHVHAVPGSGDASGLVHETVRWEWLARAAGPGRHVVRVAFGGPGAAPATAGMTDAEAAALAVGEASALLGVPLEARQVVGSHRGAYRLAPPASAMGQRERADGVRADVGRVPGLALVGAWLAGSGLARVVADAQEQADALRRRVLWGTGPQK